MSKCQARPLDEWEEEDGPVLWWKFPIEEPPYCGTPNDLGHTVEVEVIVRTRTDHCDEDRTEVIRQDVGGWPGYHTHWTPIELPSPPAEGEKEGGK